MKNPPVILPFPDRRLAPNSRVDRRWITTIRQQARTDGFNATREAGFQVRVSADLQVFIRIHPPDRRRRDDDNIISGLKSYRDGIFAALEVDDSKVKVSSHGFGKPVKGGAVYVWIEELEKFPEWLEV